MGAWSTAVIGKGMCFGHNSPPGIYHTEKYSLCDTPASTPNPLNSHAGTHISIVNQRPIIDVALHTHLPLSHVTYRKSLVRSILKEFSLSCDEFCLSTAHKPHISPVQLATQKCKCLPRLDASLRNVFDTHGNWLFPAKSVGIGRVALYFWQVLVACEKLYPSMLASIRNWNLPSHWAKTKVRNGAQDKFNGR